MDNYTLVIEGTTAPGGDNWNEFGDQVVIKPDGEAFVEAPHINLFFVDGSEDYFDELKDRIILAWDIISRLVLTDIQALEDPDEDFDPDLDGDDPAYLPWPSKTSWRGTCEMKIKDAALLPLIREMIEYVAKDCDSNTSTSFKVVQFEPEAAPAAQFEPADIKGQWDLARSRLLAEFGAASVHGGCSSPVEPQKAETAMLSPGVSVMITWDEPVAESDDAESPDDILYGSISTRRSASEASSR